MTMTTDPRALVEWLEDWFPPSNVLTEAWHDEHRAVCVEAAATITRLTEEVEGLREAAKWYAEQVAGCRKIGSAGDAFRSALDADGGSRARAQLDREGGRG